MRLVYVFNPLFGGPQYYVRVPRILAPLVCRYLSARGNVADWHCSLNGM